MSGGIQSCLVASIMGSNCSGLTWLGTETISVADGDIETEVFVFGACRSVDGSSVFLAWVRLGSSRP